MDSLEHRTLRVRAANAVDHTRSLASKDQTWRGDIQPIAGGWLVLAGPGMYVNQAMAAGVHDELTSGDVDVLVERSAAVGVVPTIEVTPATLEESMQTIERRRFEHDPDSDNTCLTRPLSAPVIDAPDDLVIRAVESEADLRIWQETSAAGWGHTSPGARRVSDAFVAAAQALDSEHMFVAFDSADNRPIGCASTTVRDGVAMLGGMSTIPAERRRGVQAALLRHRLDHARRLGCDLVVTTAATGGASERNLLRHGFTPAFTIREFSVPASGSGGRD